MSFTDVNMDPSVAIASSGWWANASLYGPSDSMRRDLEDDSHMSFNNIDMNPSIAIAVWGLYNDGSVHGPSGNTLQALGDDSPGATEFLLALRTNVLKPSGWDLGRV